MTNYHVSIPARDCMIYPYYVGRYADGRYSAVTITLRSGWAQEWRMYRRAIEYLCKDNEGPPIITGYLSDMECPRSGAAWYCLDTTEYLHNYNLNIYHERYPTLGILDHRGIATPHHIEALAQLEFLPYFYHPLIAARACYLIEPRPVWLEAFLSSDINRRLFNVC